MYVFFIYFLEISACLVCVFSLAVWTPQLIDATGTEVVLDWFIGFMLYTS